VPVKNMNDTVKAVVRMLEEGAPEIRIAAAQVLGELRLGDPSAVHALSSSLDREDPYLWTFAMDALAKIGTDAAVRKLLEQLSEGGARRERAAQVLGRVAGHGTRLIAEHFDKAPHDLQLHLLDALAKHPQREGLHVLQRALLSRHKDLAEKAAEILGALGKTLSDQQKRGLVDGVQRALAKEAIIEPDSLGAALNVLRALDGDAARATLWRYVGQKNQQAVRRAALRALAGMEITAAQGETLIGFLEEDDLLLVHAAMDLLKSVEEIGSAGRAKLKKLLEDPREDRRLFALRLMRCVRTTEGAKLCLPHLHSLNADFAAAAREALGHNPAALDLLLKGFLAEKNGDRARRYAPPLIALREHFKPVQIGALADRASKLLTASDPLSEVTLTLLVGVDPDGGARALVDKATRMRKAKKVHDALSVLARLSHAGALSPEARYQLACARLIGEAAERTRNGTAENGDATMGHFGLLVREGFPLLDRLKKEAQLTPDLLLRLGSHFAGAAGPERRFGTECLKLVADKHGRAKAAEEARQMLRLASN
jgi:HEAT repeat protein